MLKPWCDLKSVKKVTKFLNINWGKLVNINKLENISQGIKKDGAVFLEYSVTGNWFQDTS